MSSSAIRAFHHAHFDFNTDLRLLHGGKPYFNALIELIDHSQDTLHLQFYIFDDDYTGQLIIDHLLQAASRGVKIFLLVDGYASQNLSTTTLDKFSKSGIQFKFFEPLLKSKHFYFGRRLHHKIVVSDTTKAIIGGLNVSNRYNDMPGKPAWLDFAIYLEGSTARQLCILCWKTWHGFPKNLGLTPCEQIILPIRAAVDGLANVRLLRNDWVRGKVQISNTYHRLIRSAKKDIVLLCSYFLPGKTLRKLLSKAAKKGVRIRVISAGPTDVPVAKEAERWLYDWLLRNKIELYEYQPKILHGKLGICDQEWFTLGSYNINDISAHASIELNLEVAESPITQQLYEEVETLIAKDCIRITNEVRQQSKTLLTQLKQWFAYQFIRVMLYLFTFYFKQKK